MNDTAVIGLGNPLMSDDGIGLLVVERVEAQAGDLEGVDFLDLGTGGLSVVHEIAGRRRVIFIDCTFMDSDPGTIRRFLPEEVKSKKARIRYSLHEGDLLNSIRLSKEMGECPEEIVIFGIEPVKADDGMEVSQLLVNKVDEYAEIVLRELSS